MADNNLNSRHIGANLLFGPTKEEVELLKKQHPDLADFVNVELKDLNEIHPLIEKSQEQTKGIAKKTEEEKKEHNIALSKAFTKGVSDTKSLRSITIMFNSLSFTDWDCYQNGVDLAGNAILPYDMARVVLRAHLLAVTGCTREEFISLHPGFFKQLYDHILNCEGRTFEGKNIFYHFEGKKKT